MLSELPGVRSFPDWSYKIIITIYLAFSILSLSSVPCNISPCKREQIVPMHAKHRLLASTNPGRDDAWELHRIL